MLVGRLLMLMLLLSLLLMLWTSPQVAFARSRQQNHALIHGYAFD